MPLGGSPDQYLFIIDCLSMLCYRDYRDSILDGVTKYPSITND